MAIVLGTIAIVIVTVTIGMLIDRKWGLLPAPKDFDTDNRRERKKLVAHATGEAPATAPRLRAAQIDTLRTNQRCPVCRAAMRGGDDDRVRFGEVELLVLHFACSKCAATHALYIEALDR